MQWMILMRKLRAEHLTDEPADGMQPCGGDGGRHSPFGAAHGLAVCGGTAACVHAVLVPLASEMGFRDSIDGYCLLLFGRDDYDVRNISYTEERS